MAVASGPSSKSSVTFTSVAAPRLNIATRRRLAGAAHLTLGQQPARPAFGRAAPLIASSSLPSAPHDVVRSTTIGALASTVTPSVVFASDGCTAATSTVWRLFGASMCDGVEAAAIRR